MFCQTPNNTKEDLLALVKSWTSGPTLPEGNQPPLVDPVEALLPTEATTISDIKALKDSLVGDMTHHRAFLNSPSLAKAWALLPPTTTCIPIGDDSFVARCIKTDCCSYFVRIVQDQDVCDECRNRAPTTLLRCALKLLARSVVPISSQWLKIKTFHFNNCCKESSTLDTTRRAPFPQ
jgi:hypothetical protein